ncbi:MAG: hypothetical protein PHH13_04920 [Candidatus Peribacteraceae bacterium]|nr:hypothetical protein [Candidatus Peribacteraceae bacterium]
MSAILQAIAEQDLQSEDAVWLQHCNTLNSEGVREAAINLDAIAVDPSTADAAIQTARKALAVLGHVARTKGAKRETVIQASKLFERTYREALRLALAANGIEKEDERYPLLEILMRVQYSCHAYADALRSVLNHQDGNNLPPIPGPVRAQKLQ